MKVKKTMVVFVHGFLAHRWWMNRLERSFQQAGYATLNWGYKSWFQPIESHGRRLAKCLRELDADPAIEQIHFVTHSMGCIVTRSAMLKFRPEKHGRWVMLAPPNQGSVMADRLAPPLGWLMKPLAELRTREDSYVNQLEPPRNIEFSVVEAQRDYIVRGSLTHLRQEKAHLVVPGLHSAILLRQDVAEQSRHFLEHGCFEQQTIDSETEVAS